MLGAQWCHGEKNNVVYEMAKDKNLLEHSTEKELRLKFIRSNGGADPNELTKKILDFGMKIVMGEEDEMAAYHGSIGNYFAEK